MTCCKKMKKGRCNCNSRPIGISGVISEIAILSENSVMGKYLVLKENLIDGLSLRFECSIDSANRAIKYALKSGLIYQDENYIVYEKNNKSQEG